MGVQDGTRQGAEDLDNDRECVMSIVCPTQGSVMPAHDMTVLGRKWENTI